MNILQKLQFIVDAQISMEVTTIKNRGVYHYHHGCGLHSYSKWL